MYSGFSSIIGPSGSLILPVRLSDVVGIGIGVLLGSTASAGGVTMLAAAIGSSGSCSDTSGANNLRSPSGEV